MGPRTFLYGASTFFLLCGKALASTEAAPEQNPSYDLVSTKSGACLTEINAAREHAGLTGFAQATATGPDDNLPLDNAAQLWRLPCDPLASALVSTEAASEQNPSYDLVSTKSGACLTEINAAREHAGLTAFAQATATGPDENLPLDNAAQLWRLPCDPLASEGEVSKTKNELFFRTAFAYLQLPSATPNCTEAVDHWKAAFTNFKDYDLPPANDLTTQLYSTRDNTSFVAIYNPAKNATIDCRVSTCTKTTVSQPQPDGEGEPHVAIYNPAKNATIDCRVSTCTKTTVSQPDGEGEPVRNQESAHSLLCLPTPDILTLHGDPPFTKEEWEKIKSSFTQSGSAGIFNFSAAFFALATLLGVATLW
ncbi:SAG family member [Eimeria mitis]|uniref:SAG family member n=1 Tax=Eimeria mitis TaxID=44415 RepID=U6JYH7_9EIME|nr:SAG family member [Eimeria mitis]CDJ30464.1 SAG family member [Eimeria mitis]